MACRTHVELSNGRKMPTVGLGTWKSKPGQVESAVKTAIDAGYRHIDCAWIYGNEGEIGKALADKFAEGLKREDIFLTSKLWNTRHNPADVESACQDSLRLLQVDYIDLYLIHWPLSFKDGDEKFPKDEQGNMIYAYHDPCDTWKAMEALVDKGLVKSIGLSNFSGKQVEDICAIAKIKPVINQVECHPYLNQTPLLEICKKHNVIITAYSPLGSSDRPWRKAEDPRVMSDEKIEAIAKKYNKSVAQICIRFQLQRGIVVIPKSVTPERIRSNIEVFDFQISDEDMNELQHLDRNWRACLPVVERDGKVVARDGQHPHFPFNCPC